MMIIPENKLRINPAFFTKKIGNTWVILGKDKSYYRQLNEVAGFIWSLLNTRRSIPEITNHLVKHYDVSFQAARNDVEGFIAEYVRLGLLIECK